MNLYLIKQDTNDEYDTYDSAIVCAATKEKAKYIHPGNIPEWNGKAGTSSTWASVEDVKVMLIGIAKEGTKKGIILASFNAG